MFFHDYLLTWWQAGLLKIALIALGIIIGAAWPTVFKKSIVQWILWIVMLVTLIWLMIIFWPQVQESKMFLIASGVIIFLIVFGFAVWMAAKNDQEKKEKQTSFH